MALGAEMCAVESQEVHRGPSSKEDALSHVQVDTAAVLPVRDTMQDDLSQALEELRVEQNDADKDVAKEAGQSPMQASATAPLASALFSRKAAVDTTSSTESSSSSSLDKCASSDVVQHEAFSCSNQSASRTTTAESSRRSHSPCNTTTSIDLALVEALRNPRDRAFVLEYERDIVAKIRGEGIEASERQSWELPLMNTYQRMLVHRIAEYYGLAHSVDPATMRVMLAKQSGTSIPDTDLVTRAGQERLSEPVRTPFPPLIASSAGQKDLPSSSKTKEQSTASTAPASAGFRIMRRGEAGNSRTASRCESLRDGSADEGDLRGGSHRRKDRRELTMEEREASYREARQRIFGVADDRASSSSGAMTPASVSSATQSTLSSKEVDVEHASPSHTSPISGRPSLSPSLSSSVQFAPSNAQPQAAIVAGNHEHHVHSPQHRHSVPYSRQTQQQQSFGQPWPSPMPPMNPAYGFMPGQQYAFVHGGVHFPVSAESGGRPFHFASQPPPTTQIPDLAAPSFHPRIPFELQPRMYGGPYPPMEPCYPPAMPFSGFHAGEATIPSFSSGRRTVAGERTLFDPAKPAFQRQQAQRSPSTASLTTTTTSSAPPLSRHTSNGSLTSMSKSTCPSAAVPDSATLGSAQTTERNSHSTSPVIGPPYRAAEAQLPQVPAPDMASRAGTRKTPTSLPRRPDWVMAARGGQTGGV